jgi:hypothetical protein
MNTGIMSVVSTIARLGVAFAIPVLALSAWASTAQGQSSIKPGMVAFVNRCGEDLTFVSTGSRVAGLLGTLPKGQVKWVSLNDFNQGGPNLIIPYQINMSPQACPNCDGWTDLGGPPGNTQRAGWMWEGRNLNFARYCNPSLSGRGICAAQKNCCGPQMTRDGTFGTHVELTPKGGSSNDYINLSTNYGSGPHNPPKLCGPGVDPNDCVSKAANIFFNIPVAWSSNQHCSFTSKRIQVLGGKCLAVSCPDAYTHPTDDKQTVCPTNANRGYEVVYCPL